MVAQRKLKGDIGEAQAILHFVKNGDEVYSPFTENAKYDFLIRRGGQILRVSVKYSSYMSGKKWYVDLRQTHQHKNETKTTYFDNTEFDLVVVYLAAEDRIVEIPASQITSKHSVRIKPLLTVSAN